MSSADAQRVSPDSAWWHCHDKLFRLGAEYMRTAAGVAFAKEQTSVLRDELYARGIPEVALRT